MVKYAPRKVYIRESGGYVELSYTEFCRCRESDQTYMDKLFIPIQMCIRDRYLPIESLNNHESLEVIEKSVRLKLKEKLAIIEEKYGDSGNKDVYKRQGLRKFMMHCRTISMYQCGMFGKQCIQRR